MFLVLTLFLLGAAHHSGSATRHRATRQNRAMRVKLRRQRRPRTRRRSAKSRKCTTGKRDDNHYDNSGGRDESFLTSHERPCPGYMSKQEMVTAMHSERTITNDSQSYSLWARALFISTLLATCICIKNQVCFNPYVSCRIGEASNPGPSAPEEPPDDFVDESESDDDGANDAPVLADSSSDEEMMEQHQVDDSSSDEEMDVATVLIGQAPEHRAVISELMKGANGGHNQRTKPKAAVCLMPDKTLFDLSPWFIPAICVRGLPKYGGSAPGYVFTTVDSKTGYYADDPTGRADRTREPLAKPSAWQAILDLVKWPTVATANSAPPAYCDPQPQWAKRTSDQRSARKKSKTAKSLPRESLLNHTTLDSKLAKDMNLCSIDSWNMNAWLTGNEAAARSSADAVALQETRTTDSETRDRQECAKSAQGWNARINLAVTTEEGGRSAGVAIMAKKHIGYSSAANDSIATNMRSRIASAWVNTSRKGGFHVITVYLWTAEGMTPRNIEIMAEVSKLTKVLRGPWVVAGDFNVNPEALKQWAIDNRATIHHSKAPTCHSNHYDYFIVHRSLTTAVAGVQTIDCLGGRPHYGVRLLLNTGCKDDRIWTMLKPKQIPSTLPAGCAHQEQDYW